MAQRMTMLYGFNSPEFFDRSLFKHFIDLLESAASCAFPRQESWSSMKCWCGLPKTPRWC